MYGNSGGLKLRLIIMLIMGAVAFFSYLGKTQINPITGEKQRVGMSPEQEVAMGLQSAPSMADEYGGLYQNQEVQDYVKRVGDRLVNSSEAKTSPYQFAFHALADEQTVNAFALPGGQIFITMALLKRLESEDQLAGVLGHEIGHVINRHSAEQMAKSDFYQGLVGAVSAGMNMGQVAQYVAQMKLMKFGREDEIESDDYGIKYMLNAKYKPEGMIRVMEILKEASGGQSRDEFSSSHPSPENRIAKINEAIAKYRK
jgi:beta-barrel assembly-enhancing protease